VHFGRRGGDHREFRNMRIVRHQPAHPLYAEPRAETIDEIGEWSADLPVCVGCPLLLDTLQVLVLSRVRTQNRFPLLLDTL